MGWEEKGRVEKGGKVMNNGIGGKWNRRKEEVRGRSGQRGI